MSYSDTYDKTQKNKDLLIWTLSVSGIKLVKLNNRLTKSYGSISRKGELHGFKQALYLQP